MNEPKEVRRLVADLHEAGFGEFVFVNGTPGGAWEVGIEGEHVRAAAGFVFRNGKTRRADGTMAIDGKPAPLAEDMEDLRRIWTEHEETAPEPEAGPAVLMEIADPGRVPVPQMVQFAADKMTAGGAEHGFEVRIGVAAGGHWAVGIDLPEGDGLRLVFSRYQRNLWELDRDRPIQVVVDGTDRSGEVGGDVEKALSVLLKHTPPPPNAPPPGTSAVGKRESSRPTTGVATRKMVVIRELA